MKRPDLILLACCTLLPATLPAQGWREAGIWATAVASRPGFGGAGLALAWRDPLRTRLGLAAAVGAEEDAGVAGRIEGMWHFLLDPYRRAGNAIYGGAGLALQLTNRGALEPGVQLVVGVEGAPASRRSGYIELGVGRGARVAIGMRWRKRVR